LLLEPGTSESIGIIRGNKTYRAVHGICDLAGKSRFTRLSWTGQDLDEATLFFEAGLEGVKRFSFEHGCLVHLLNTLSKFTQRIE
jgi:hypothetical protein